MLQFSADSEMVHVLEDNFAEEIVIAPGRREGWQHVRKEKVGRLAVAASFASIEDLPEEERPRRYDLSASDTSWTIEEMPEDVQERFFAWRDSDAFPTEYEVRHALHETAQTPMDRMTETVECPHCPKDPRYACYTSGYSRKLYKFPLVQVRGVDSADAYELPLDAAMLVECKPEAFAYETVPYFSREGQLSARRIAEIDTSSLPAEYIVAVSGGAITPRGSEYQVYPKRGDDNRFAICTTEWFEKTGPVPSIPFAAHSIVDELQKKITMQHIERVVEPDYNEMFDATRSELGRLGLTLAFRIKYAFGEYDSEFVALDEKRQFVATVEDYDAFAAIQKYEALVAKAKIKMGAE